MQKGRNGGKAPINHSRRCAALLTTFFIYILTVLWYTVIMRSIGIHNAQFELFWSYKKWLAGDMDLGHEILANIVMFVPFGFLMSSMLPSRLTGKARTAVVISLAIIFSLLIETLQLFLMRGLFEWDDIISNGTGALIGIALYTAVKRWKSAHEVIVGIFTIACIIVIITGRNAAGVEADITPRLFCFQIDSSSCVKDELELTGFAFRYGHVTTPPVVILRSTQNRKKIKMSTMQTWRPDVNNYFLCEHDYTMSGFAARGRIEDDEYEIMVKWPWMIPLSTGVYVTDGSVHYTEEKNKMVPDTADAPDLEEIINKGILRVYRPDFHCYVYQKDRALYWIVDSDFNFEADDTTYIQYQLWTTQTDKLPEKRLKNNCLWDNIGGYFEDYELHGDFGPYRVMKRELPKEYAITSIMTGYYKDGEWIWKNYFRPVYDFSKSGGVDE